MRETLVAISALMLLCAAPAGAQSDPYDHYYNNAPGDRSADEIDTDHDLFLRPIEGRGGIFGRVAEFGFAGVRYSRRGLPLSMESRWLGGASLTGLLTGVPDWSAVGVLGRANAPVTVREGSRMGSRVPGLAAGTEEFDASVKGLLPPGYGVTLLGYNRRGRQGATLSAAADAGDGSSWAVWVSRRWGRDAYYKGVFTDEMSAVAGFERRFARGQVLSVMLVGAWSENGLPASATAEAFELTGDRYYNPSWGMWDGRERSSRVAERFTPLAVVTYGVDAGEMTRLTATASLRAGADKYVTLGWSDARAPWPDYYRYMPGYADNPAAAEIMERRWRGGDPAIVRIDWGELVSQNRMSDRGAVYFVEERVGEVRDVQLALSGETRPRDGLRFDYGVRGRIDSRRNYKRVADLLGGGPFADTDPYLTGDELVGDLLENDMRHPGRRVGRGDRFGYDYRMTATRTDVYGMVDYAPGRARLAAGIELGGQAMWREGYYEKELFPGRASSGRSEKLSFSTYTAKASAGWSFSARHFVDVSGVTARLAPAYGTVFLSPDYNNHTIANPDPVRLAAADATYTARLGAVNVEVTGFWSATRDESAVYRYWDDIASVYADMVARGIATRSRGVEVGAEAALSSRFSILAGASAGDHRYASDPVVDISADATGNPIVRGARSYMDGYRLPNAPQRALSAELRYSSPGWVASLTVSRAEGRYIAITPLRRMQRAYDLSAAPERFGEFVEQERFDAATTLDLFVLRSFRTAHGSVTALAAVNNLLDERSAVYSGYEQMRIMRRGSEPNELYSPFPSKYMYAYGRTYYVSVSYRF